MIAPPNRTFALECVGGQCFGGGCRYNPAPYAVPSGMDDDEEDEGEEENR